MDKVEVAKMITPLKIVLKTYPKISFLLGVCPATVKRWHKQRAYPDAKNLYKLLSLYNYYKDDASCESCTHYIGSKRCKGWYVETRGSVEAINPCERWEYVK